jgi:spermidine/putrescine transport system substrate-binding protein
MDYGATERLSNGDWAASVNWNGVDHAGARQHQRRRAVRLSEGRLSAVHGLGHAAGKDAQNVEEAYKFLDFIMLPENAAMISAFARYANGIAGSEPFMPEDMKTAPEVVIPEEFKAAGHVPADLHRQGAGLHHRDLDRVAEVRPGDLSERGVSHPPHPPWDI